MRKVITGIDIGTSKVCAAIAGITDDDKIKIGGVGSAQARGVNKGFVSNLDKLVDSIDAAVGIAEDKAGVIAHQVVVNISGPSVSGSITEGLMPLSKRGKEITRSDIQRLIETTKEISYSLDRDFLYWTPQEFIVNESESVEDPVGLFGTKLKVKLYLITALVTHIQNITRAVNYAGYDMVDIVPTGVALASSLVRDEDKDGGALLIIDMGGGITEMAIYHRDLLKFFDSVNVGGMDLTAHLSGHYKIPFENAEQIKKRYGNISLEDFKRKEKSIFDIDGRKIVIESDTMNRLLMERFEEIFHILTERLNASTYPFSSVTSVVVYGGGALLNGALETFERLFNIPVKMGYSSGAEGDPSVLSNPAYSAAISLARFGLNKHALPRLRGFNPKAPLVNLCTRFKDFLEEYF